MKMNLLKGAFVLLASALLLGSCSDDKNSSAGQPAPQTVLAFTKQFPHATNVFWTQKRGYDVASFNLNGTRAVQNTHTAWYPLGSAKLTYTKMEISWEELLKEAPAVADAWLHSQYKAEGYKLDDIDVKTYEGEAPIYKLEAEKGDVEYELTYNQMGELLSAVLDTDDSDEDDEDMPAPQEILDFVKDNMPNATIVDVDLEDDYGYRYYEVEVIEKNQKEDDIELIFTEAGKFVHVAYEIDDDDYEQVLSAELLDAFRQLEPQENWDEVLLCKDLNGKVLYYALCIEIEQEPKDIEYVILTDEQGAKIKEYR